MTHAISRRTNRWAVAALLLLSACASNSGDGEDATAGPDTSPAEAPESTESTEPSASTDGAGTADGATTEPSDAPADESSPPETTDGGAGDAEDGVHQVPGEYDTIQAAVDAAAEGDLVLIAEGTYHEAVDVSTPNLVIRGVDRDKVILDGELELDNGIRSLGADGIAVENLTAMNYTANGVFFVETTGYRASYVTTYRTGDYGIYAFDSQQGQIEYAHTVGSKDGGLYIGQCYPCDAVINHSVSSHNGLGYSGTNAGGNLIIANSVWHNNRVGIVPNSGSYELCYPQRDSTIIGNLVYDNNQGDTAAIDVALLAQRNGILVAGGIGNVIERNRVDGHLRTGIGLVPFLEEAPVDDLPTEEEWAMSCEEQKQQAPTPPAESLLWNPYDNEIRDNVVTDSGEADIALASVDTDLASLRNCLAGNEAATYAPTALAELAPCDGEPAEGDWAAGDLGVARWLGEIETLPPAVPWQEAPLPELGEHEQMPDAATAPAKPATDVPYQVDLAAIEVPELPAEG